MGHTLTASTIHLSLICYLLAVVCWITGRRGNRYRGLWTAGCLFLVVHALCAFHFYLDWSHAAAVQLTAEQTQERIGVSFGRGIWASYLLIAVWTVDAVLMWRKRDHEAKWWPWFNNAVHAYAFFILFNGTVVFEEGAVQLGGIIGTIWLARLGWKYRGARSRSRTTELQG